MDKFDQIMSNVISPEDEMVDTLYRFYRQWIKADENKKEMMAMTFESLKIIYADYDIEHIMREHGWWRPFMGEDIMRYTSH